MEETLRELASEHAVLHESLERAEAIERELGRYHRELQAERDQLRAELENVGKVLRSRRASPLIGQTVAEAVNAAFCNAELHISGLTKQNATTRARAEAAESTVAGLRQALEELKAEYESAGSRDDDRRVTYDWSLTRINYALAASPADHDRRIKSEALRAAEVKL